MDFDIQSFYLSALLKPMYFKDLRNLRSLNLRKNMIYIELILSQFLKIKYIYKIIKKLLGANTGELDCIPSRFEKCPTVLQVSRSLGIKTLLNGYSIKVTNGINPFVRF